MSDNKIEVPGILLDFLSKYGIVPVEVPKRNYWFLRTQGGEYFEEFFLEKYIGIGWDDVPCLAESERTDKNTAVVRKTYDRTATRVLNQVYRFCKEMKTGDIVIIPSSHSNSFAFGLIESDDYYEATKPSLEDLESGSCPYIKRRKIKWISSAKRHIVDSKLYLFFRNQQALSNATEYAEYIERALNPFYIRAGVAHINYHVDRTTDIPGLALPIFMGGILTNAKAVKNELLGIEDDGISFGPDGISTRVNVQSPGVIEFLGDPISVLAIAAIGVVIVGGKFSFKCTEAETSGSLSTEGLTGFIIKLLEIIKGTETRKAPLISQEVLKKSCKDLDLKDPFD